MLPPAQATNDRPRKFSMSAGSTIANVDLCGGDRCNFTFFKTLGLCGGCRRKCRSMWRQFCFFPKSRPMRGVSVEFLDLCGVSLALFSPIVIIGKGASHEFSVFVRPSVCWSVRPSVRPSVCLSVHPSVRPSVRLSIRSSISVCDVGSVRPMPPHPYYL